MTKFLSKIKNAIKIVETQTSLFRKKNRTYKVECSIDDEEVDCKELKESYLGVAAPIVLPDDPWFGPEYFQDEDHIVLIEQLKASGLCFEKEDEGLDSEALAGLSIVISGTFNQFSREEIKKMIEMNGGKNVSSISKKTSILVAGENMGPSKLKKATDLNIEIINEETFLNRINK